MKSRDSIKSELTAQAHNLGYYGDVVNVATGLLSYVLYHNQTEILNAMQESSLSTAKLMNSKITECMNNMYSVYRGLNAKVRLRFKSNIKITKNKFDVIYSSNTFKVLASDVIDIVPGENADIIGILSVQDKLSGVVTINSVNKYAIDILDQTKHVVGNLSELIRVFINTSGTDNDEDYLEYPITRNFFDHVNTPIYKPSSNEEPAISDLDKIFALTIPDYGIRLFKRGYFDPDLERLVGYFQEGTKVKYEVLKFTTADEINPDEFNKIFIKGTEEIPDPNDPDQVIPYRTLINEIPKEDSNSILYNANCAMRTNNLVRSMSDVSVLFTETFKDQITYSDSRLALAGEKQDESNPNGIGSTTLSITYIPVDEPISNNEIQEFKQKYSGYLVTTNLIPLPAPKVTLRFKIGIELTGTDTIDDEVKEVLAKFENRLTSRSSLSADQVPAGQYNTMFYDQLIDINVMRSGIAKISPVVSITQFELDPDNPQVLTYGSSVIPINSDEIITSYYNPTDGVRIPVYYEIIPLINYSYKYESISKR